MGIKYSTIAISGYNASPPSDSGAQTDENKIKWSTSKTKLGDPLNNAIVAIDSALVTAFAQEALLKTTNYTTTAGDNGKLLEVTGTNTISLYDASTGGAGYQINVLNTGVGTVVVGRATAGNLINGVAQNWTLNPGTGASFRVNSTNNGYDAVSTSGSGDMFAWGGTAGGTANALTISTTPATTAYVVGQTFRFIVGTANTGNASLSVNGLGITSIAKEGNVGLAAGDMPLGSLMQVTYGGTFFHLHRPSSTSFGDVVHTSGNESIAGVKTFTGAIPIVMSSTQSVIQGRDTDIALPNGLWRLFLPAGDGLVYFEKNTAAAGDFTTSIDVLLMSGTQATFTVPVAVASAVGVGDAVTKAQLDAKVYGGRIANNGTASVAYGPSGWTVSRGSVGNTTVTHNLGTTNYSVTPGGVGAAGMASISGAIASNSFNVVTTSSGSTLDLDYNFVLARN